MCISVVDTYIDLSAFHRVMSVDKGDQVVESKVKSPQEAATEAAEAAMLTAKVMEPRTPYVRRSRSNHLSTVVGSATPQNASTSYASYAGEADSDGSSVKRTPLNTPFICRQKYTQSAPPSVV